MRLYRLLLNLYPAGFRAEYGDEMSTIFARRMQDAGALTSLWVWLHAVTDLLFNAVGAHFDLLIQDLKYAVRTLAKDPGFTVTTVLVMALGVGANTAAFTVMDTVLLRPLPYEDSSRLIKIWESKPGYPQMEFSPVNFRDWKAQATTVESMGAFRSQAVNLVGSGEPLHMEGTGLTSEMLPMLGAKAFHGRIFTPQDDAPDASRTLILSYGLWRTEFGADPSVIGRTVSLDNRPHIVIGVMPPDFQFPNLKTRFWTAMRFGPRDYEDRSNNYIYGVGKLKPGVTLEQARQEFRIIAANLERAYPAENEKTGATVNLLREEISSRSKLLVTALTAAAICLLLIACLNLANLQLARGMSRQRELAVRASLGAGRERLVRQLATEAMLLALLGGTAGILVASTSLPFLARLVPDSLPAGQLHIDIRVLGFALALTVISGLAFGVLPSLRVAGGLDSSAMREGRSSMGGRKERVRSALVTVEIALSMTLLITTGLLLRALWKVQSTDPGFRAEGVMTARMPLPMPKYAQTAKRSQLYNRVFGEIRQIPGVTGVAAISFLPMTLRGGIWPVSVQGLAKSRTERNTASLRFVTPGFFAAMNIPIMAGRDVSDSDRLDSQPVAVVSESFAKRYWPGQDPLGRGFQIGLGERTVAGVVRDIRVRGLEASSEPQVYLPFQQVGDGNLSFYSPKDIVVRSTLDPAAVAESVRRIVRNADPELPITAVKTLTEVVNADTAPRSTQARMLGAFAALAALLAAVGIHGLLSFAVSQRTQEIGLRMALGADRRDIFRLVARDSLVLGIIGMTAGLAIAYAAGVSMSSLLAGIEPADPVTFGSAAAVCLLMTIAGSLWPVYHAVRIDPSTAIRTE